ncbi:FtsQ-type POTRA domain-containing protein [Streptococcus didelphis]|uniref:FtsQ-type POTRA domain-containing protein n=2 Tax=Streptococcus didelphis TaxID=102886 RepID=A0ABY9LGV5_9STRE|nr:FtsQ-type POTRA domain-containing protein [Streptococcus didelphis]WMB28054.1 FtsQ-type POTRA domain-containing protein [Streptococcus didelphis]
MTKNKDTKQDLDAKPVKEPIELTEWQKRNIEFLKKQKEKAAEEKKQKKSSYLKKATVLHQSDDLSSQSEDKENIKDSSLGQEAQENQEASQVEEELTQNYEESQDLTKAKKPKRIKHRKKEKSKGQQAFIKSLPVLLISLLVLSLSLFLLSPYSKMKEFSAKGNKHVTLTELIEQSQIKSSDYFFKVAFSSARFAENVKLSNPWIKKLAWIISYLFILCLM